MAKYRSKIAFRWLAAASVTLLILSAALIGIGLMSEPKAYLDLYNLALSVVFIATNLCSGATAYARGWPASKAAAIGLALPVLFGIMLALTVVRDAQG